MPQGQHLSEEQTKELYARINSRAYYFLVPNSDEGGYDLIPKLYLIAEEVGCSPDTVQYHANKNFRKYFLNRAKQWRRTESGQATQQRTSDERQRRIQEDEEYRNYVNAYQRDYQKTEKGLKISRKGTARANRKNFKNMKRGFRALGYLSTHVE